MQPSNRLPSARHARRDTILRVTGGSRPRLLEAAWIVALFLIFAAWSCSSERTTLVTRYPLAAFGGEAETIVSTAGRPTARWVAVGNLSRPAIVGRGRYSVAFDRAHVRGRRLRATLAVVGAPGSGGSATFRIRTRAADGHRQTVLLQERVSRDPRPIDLRLPPASQESRLLLEVTAAIASVDAAFVDPWLDGEREAPALSPGSRNLLLITLDTSRADALGCYGGGASTPNLDRLAAAGHLFEKAFSVAFGTTPSHASLMTASPAARHGVYNNKTALGDELPVLASVLAEQGYATAAFVSAKPLARVMGLDRGFDLFDDVLVLDPASGLGRYSKAERRAARTTDRALEWLASVRAIPFFAWIHYFDPHQPYSPVGWAADEGDLRGWFETSAGKPRYVRPADTEALSSTDLKELARAGRRRYLREIEQVDAQVGRLLAALEGLEVDDRTVVAVVGDHGEHFGERGREHMFAHHTLFDEVSRVPLLIAWAGDRSRQRRHEQLVGTLDVAPTLLDLLEVEVPAPWSGESLLPAMIGDGRVGAARSLLVLEGAWEDEIAVRTQRWFLRVKLEPDDLDAEYLGYGEADLEVYRITGSGMEPTDPSDCPALGRLLETVKEALAEKSETQAMATLSSEQLQSLRALGYTR